jgi:tetratricopeptide (TPR) repeat protein
MLAVEEGREKDALACFDQALQLAPRFLDARRFRAVLLARRGDFARAFEDIAGCLKEEPAGGVTLYAAACVYARAVDKYADPSEAQKAATQALAYLQQAFSASYGQDRAAQDADLAGIRHFPEFQQLLKNEVKGKSPVAVAGQSNK